MFEHRVFMPGDMLSPAYRIVRLIERGGMGAVYEVEHLRLGKAFAAKVLLADLSRDRECILRLEREARAASRIHHPNIVEVFDLDTTPDGIVFIVLELLRGHDLRKLLARGPLIHHEAAAITVQVASALQAAHDAGIVHRDLKPANIFLCDGPEQPRVKVLDFGICKLRMDETTGTLTRPGVVIGTPSYMSPDQATSAGEVDARSDIYSLGIILFEMLTGRVPFETTRMIEVLIQHATTPPPAPSTLEPHVPREMDLVVLRALAKTPGDRFQTMRELIDALRHAVAAPTVVPRTNDTIRLPERLPPAAPPELQQEIIGTSDAMKRVREQIVRAARGMGAVLLRGEIGTGKRIAARMIHDQSGRKTRPFVELSCGRVQPSMMAAELFGCEPGAMPGVISAKVGRIELAAGGTFYIPEIERLQPEVQANLVRVLEDRRVERVGGTQSIPIDVRFIAATHVDLEAMVAAGTFRRDLFLRLNVLPIRITPLSTRLEDVEPLAVHFAEKIAARADRPAPIFDAEATKLLRAQPWDGNIAELETFVERLIDSSDDEAIIRGADVERALSRDHEA